NASFDFNIDKSLYDPKHYEYYFQDGFLGSIGKRASLAVATPESISFIFPKFETDLTIRIPSRKLDKCGDFQITYKYNEKLREYAMQEKNVYDSSLYSLYSWGDDAVVFMHNNQLKSPKKILIIRDSFNCVVAPFLILGIKDLITLDLRSFTGSIRSFVDQNVPDIVLVFYYPNIISDLIENNPQRSFFDFR
ncbi:MAG: hypothetical protein LBJ36_07595, partial [Synergistaceae bacterium]|nr:hypothetical protein [Synergistaceae bacterium]